MERSDNYLKIWTPTKEEVVSLRIVPSRFSENPMVPIMKHYRIDGDRDLTSPLTFGRTDYFKELGDLFGQSSDPKERAMGKRLMPTVRINLPFVFMENGRPDLERGVCWWEMTESMYERLLELCEIDGDSGYSNPDALRDLWDPVNGRTLTLYFEKTEFTNDFGEVVSYYRPEINLGECEPLTDSPSVLAEMFERQIDLKEFERTHLPYHEMRITDHLRSNYGFEVPCEAPSLPDPTPSSFDEVIRTYTPGDPSDGSSSLGEVFPTDPGDPDLGGPDEGSTWHPTPRPDSVAPWQP